MPVPHELMASFVDVPVNSHFPLQNLPYGVFSRRSRGAQPSIERSVGVAIGNHVLDLAVLQKAGLFAGQLKSVDCFQKGTLNAFMQLGKPAWAKARATLTRLLSADEPTLRDNLDLKKQALVPMAEVDMHLPADIGDYTDFYASREHATNCGMMFRSKDKALSDNWLHLPVGYHGRSSSIVVSGTPVRRPRGQIVPPGAAQPEFAPCAALDFELEMACLIGSGNAQGEAISTADADDHIFGLVLMNDWSARDIQKWEYVPLGPFNGKNWATSISPWVVTLEALQPFRVAAPGQEPPILPYLEHPQRQTYDIQLEVALQPGGSDTASVITESNARHLYWTWPQMVAHHTAGGCNLRPGDLFGSGTVSCEGPKGRASLLELSWGGTQPFTLDDGMQRTYLEDGDTVTLTGFCQGDGYRVGFGSCTGTVLPVT
ncbi:hypothetical protein WJX72_008989 [[Myrmecia] bisecta]|uniref:Fumarylacetoacetase n=1 Tax=[Myrmecia] bisecta TaxID=41462 RepID=A0AAW1PTS7_9CHLO